jgi:mono/diheme cytochrome c family protein
LTRRTRSGFRAGPAPPAAATLALAALLGACYSFPPPPPGFSTATWESIAANRELDAFAFREGRAIYLARCARCHGDEREGEPGYPSLADDEWTWGASAAEIAEVVRHGVRALDNDNDNDDDDDVVVARFRPETKRGPDQSPP